VHEPDVKTRAIARGMIILVGDQAEATALKFVDFALAQGNSERARTWQSVLEYIAAFKNDPTI
jgi:hypothetical protein